MAGLAQVQCPSVLIQLNQNTCSKLMCTVNKIIKILRTLRKWVLFNLIDKFYCCLKDFNKSYNNSTLKRTLG